LLRTEAVRRGESEMWSFDYRTSGELFEMPSGRWLMGAFGYEFRYEDIFDNPSPEARSTPENPEPTLRFSFTEAQATRRQNAAYAEFFVPLAEQFELQLPVDSIITMTSVPISIRSWHFAGSPWMRSSSAVPGRPRSVRRRWPSPVQV